VPLVHRFKSWEGLPEEDRGTLIERELRLTRVFLDENLPRAEIGRVVLAAPAHLETPWLEWLGDGLGRRAEPLRREHLPLAGELPAAWREVAPMVGAAAREVR
jgi:hypothetical protein